MRQHCFDHKSKCYRSGHSLVMCKQGQTIEVDGSIDEPDNAMKRQNTEISRLSFVRLFILLMQTQTTNEPQLRRAATTK